jgi:hypothetical protein
METRPEVSKNFAVRYAGCWYEIIPTSYESERQTYQIAWKMIRGSDSKTAYREWFSEEREMAKLLYPVIKNE